LNSGSTLGADSICPSRVERSDHPFRHVVFDDFFSPEIYRGLCFEFNDRLNFGLEESPKPFRFVRSYLGRLDRQPTYDAYFLAIPPQAPWPLPIFYSQEFYQYIGSEFQLPLTTDVVATFHHHAKGSRAGVCHTDFVTCNFDRAVVINGLHPDPGGSRSQGARRTGPGVTHAARAIGLIYYLNNAQWSPGDGGETALYGPNGCEPVVQVAPLNNRLLAFSVSPISAHAFLSNQNNPRNSAVIWLHASPRDMANKFNVMPGFS
jgi:hypothetical protein